MGQWHRENPEEATRIAALPPSQQLSAERAAIGFDPDSTLAAELEQQAREADQPIRLTIQETKAILQMIDVLENAFPLGVSISSARQKLEDWLNLQ